MATSVVMPALEMAQETGRIVSWLKKEGEAISKGDPLLEVETDKAVVEIEATADGVLAGIKSHDGDVVTVGVTIAWIVAPGEVPPAELPSAAPAARKTSEPASSHPTAAPAKETPASSGEGATRISPKARRLAEERGLDIRHIRGTGPDGSITSEDVLKAADAQSTPAEPLVNASDSPTTHAPQSAIARLMAERTTQSWTQVPHFFLVREIDAGGLLETREQQDGAKVSHTDLLVALTARVLKKHPKMNASWAGNGIHLNPEVNMSVAMAVTDGVVGAVIRNADAVALADIATQRRELTERARSGRLKPADMAGGTFTITNLGMYGIDAFNAIIAPPQAAILAVGRIGDRVVARNGQPIVRAMMTLTLSCDHRVVDGAQAAVFLSDLAEAIRKPDDWLGARK